MEKTVQEMPKWNELLLLTLEVYGDKNPHKNREMTIKVADNLRLPEELRRELNVKARDNKIENRVGWAISALKIAGLLKLYKRGENIITDEGLKLLRTRNGKDFDEKFLIENYESYRENLQKNIERNRNKIASNDKITSENSTPEELIEHAVIQLESDLSDKLIAKLREMNPYQFEQVVADLLKAMGYGVSFVTKKSGDGGVDAVINEDKLGLGKIYAQAKRYAEKNVVQEQEITNFFGKITSDHISKGVFISTSDFSGKAKDFAQKNSIRLINGEEITQLMIEYGVGVSVLHNYQIKRIDSDYFEGEDI